MNRKRPLLFVVSLLAFVMAAMPLATPTPAFAAEQTNPDASIASRGPLHRPDLEEGIPEEGGEEGVPEEGWQEERAEELTDEQLPGNNPADVELVNAETVFNPVDDSAMLILSPDALTDGAAALTARPAIRNDYLVNPGIGWQEAHRPDAPLLPETVAYRRPEYNWKLLNPAPGVYNWALLDADLQAAVAQGKQFSFRIYTMRGVGQGGGHQLPGWLFDRGGALRSNGEPDYANCAYQEEWARFVDALRARYDGNPNVAFIDISGYGEFNEWNYGEYTTWEDGTLDSMARQRLADAFIGGSATIQCRDLDWHVHTRSYNYRGFQRTQLVMPYGGIQKTSRYVAGRRPDVGIRHDCLGSPRYTDSLMDKIGDVIAATWRNAPVIFEFCNNSGSEPNFFSNARTTLQEAHGSVVHDNLAGSHAASVVRDAIRYSGYRYVVRQTTFPSYTQAGRVIEVTTTWANVGYAPAYTRMGQDLLLRFYLLDPLGNVSYTWTLRSDPNTWMPADPLPGTPPDQNIRERLLMPGHLAGGRYTLATAIVNTRNWRPIQLGVQGQDSKGRLPLGTIYIYEANRVFAPITSTDETE